MDATFWSAVFTLVIAAETAAYVWITHRLWKTTKAAADAAKFSADAAKLSADIAATLNRPYMSLLHLILRNDPNSEQWAVACTLKNFGALPARRVKLHVQVLLSGQSTFNHNEPAAVEFFPSQEATVWLSVPMPPKNRQIAFTTSGVLSASVQIEYATGENRWYRFSARAPFVPATANFAVEESFSEEIRA